jgi:hypothetical protein
MLEYKKSVVVEVDKKFVVVEVDKIHRMKSVVLVVQLQLDFEVVEEEDIVQQRDRGD